MTADKRVNDDLLDALAEDFVARYRRGDRPSLVEFTSRYPELADEIRDLFPALAMMEEARPRDDDTLDISAGSDSRARLDRVGEYRILREVGRGGMGIVYEAEQESLGRHVAVKVLPAHSLLEPRYLQRFQREARAVARLHHTNIVPVFGVGEHDGLNYYVMQFIQGRGLDEILLELRQLRHSRRGGESFKAFPTVPEEANAGTRNPDDASAVRIAEGLVSGEFRAASAPPEDPPVVTPDHSQPAESNAADGTPSSDLHLPRQDQKSGHSDGSRAYWLSVARIGAQVADALAHAHAQGVLHRDIKPSNLLLDVHGTVWVTDFGLAKEVSPNNRSDRSDAGPDLTRTGDVVGTLRYLAPERLKGDSDRRSDVYSLGATLYEMLTLHPPFEESDRSVLVRRLLHDEPTRPRMLDPSIPLDLETIVVKAIAKESVDRYKSAGALADDLRCFLADRPIQARRATIWERTWRLCRRNPTVTGLSAAVVVLAALLAIGAPVAGWIRTERDLALRNLTRAERAELDARHNMDRARQAERDATIRNHLTQAIVYRKRGDTGHQIRSLREIDQALTLGPDGEMQNALRNELIANLAHTDVFPAKSWKCPDGALDIDPTFERYARCTRDGVISVRRVADDKELLRFKRPSAVDARSQLKFSPDGNYLASFAFDHTLIVWDLKEGRQVLDDVGCAWDISFDFTADSRGIISGHEKEILVYDLATATVKSRWPTEFAPWCVSCSPDGDSIGISPEGNDPPHRLQILSSAGGGLVAELPAKDWVFDIAWHPNGKTIAFSCNDGMIYLWDVGRPKPHRKLGQHLGGMFVAFSHDGNLLASSGWSQLMLWEPRTAELVSTAKSMSQRARFRPDDRQIALFRDGPEIGILDLFASNVFRYFLHDDRRESPSLMCGGFSPDGRLLAIGTMTGLSFWDFETGQELAFAPIEHVDYLQFDDSRSLLTAPTVLNRWPIRADGERLGRVIVGPPETIPVWTPSEFGISRDGRVLVVAQYEGAVVIHAASPDTPIHLGPHYDCRYLAVSGDGRWVATGSHFGTKVKVWDAGTGDLVATLPIEMWSRPRFSPDDRWLATTGGGARLWRVGTWHEGPVVNGSNCDFSPDGRMIAIESGYGSVRLVDPDTGQEYAELEHPKGYGSNRYIFTPDGTSLVGVATGRKSGFAWDLRRIRKELSARGLDWNAPPDLPRHTKEVIPPTVVELVLAEPDSRTPLEIATAEIDRFRRAHDANPENARACNDLAWALANAPPELRRAEEAVEFSTKAVQLEPDSRWFANTLGVAYYRAGRYRDAVDSLTTNLAQQDDSSLTYDLYFLAMSYYQLGEPVHARDYLIWANRWTDSRMSEDDITPAQLAELALFRAEAEALIQ